jgi:hypothetical protein
MPLQGILKNYTGSVISLGMSYHITMDYLTFFFAIKNKDGSLVKLPQSRARVENGVHHRQCDHTARKASLFCDIHKNRKPDVIKTLHMAFKTLEQRNKSIEE